MPLLWVHSVLEIKGQAVGNSSKKRGDMKKLNILLSAFEHAVTH